MRRVLPLKCLYLLLVAICATGCGDSTNLNVPLLDNQVATTRVTVESNISARQVPNNVDSYVFYGLAGEEIVFGPIPQAAAANVTVLVPQSVDQLRFALRDGQNTIGVYQQNVNLRGLSQLVISDPNWVNAPDFLSGLQVSATPTSVRETESTTLQVLGELESGGTADVTAFATLQNQSPSVLQLNAPNATGLDAGTATLTASLFFFEEQLELVVQDLPFFASLTLLTKDFETGEAATDNLSSSALGWSDDGQSLVFASHSPRLVSGDVGVNDRDLFLYSVANESIEKISVTHNGAAHSNSMEFVGVSQNGRQVAFASTDDNFVPSDSLSNSQDIFLRDLDAGTTSILSTDTNGDQILLIGSAVFSSNGRYIVFSTLQSLLPSDTNSQFDLYRKDLQTNSFELLMPRQDDTVSPAGFPFASVLDISSDGNTILFITNYATLNVDEVVGTTGNTGVFLREVNEGRTTFLGQSDGFTGFATLSADARFVSFESASNLFNSTPADFGDREGFIWDRLNNSFVQTNVDSNEQRYGSSDPQSPRISDDGRFASFAQHAADAESGFPGGFEAVFLRDTVEGNSFLVARNRIGEPFNAESSSRLVSPDGNWIAIESDATNIEDGDTVGDSQLYIVRNPVFFPAP